MRTLLLALVLLFGSAGATPGQNHMVPFGSVCTKAAPEKPTECQLDMVHLKFAELPWFSPERAKADRLPLYAEPVTTAQARP